MKKLLLFLSVLSIGVTILRAGWTSQPPANATQGTYVTVSASGTANAGYNPITYLVLWVQDPSGTWNHPVLGTGVNGANISGSVGWTLNTAGTWHWQVTTTAGAPSGSTPYGTTWATATTQVGPISTTFSFSNLGPHTYDGSTKTATVTPNPGGATYTSDLTKGPNAGSYTVSATATGNYTGSGSATLTINAVSTSFSLSSTSFTYTGSAQGPSVQASPGNATFNTGGTLSATAAGNYTATATAYGNYTGSNSSLNWTINPVSTSFSLSSTSFAYTGSAQGPSVVANPSNATFSTGGTLSATAPGNYTATASAYGNYTGSNSSLNWTIGAPPGDADADGVPDSVETLLGTNPSSPNGSDTNNQTTQLKTHRPTQSP